MLLISHHPAMTFSRRQIARIIYIAMLAVLMAALAPTVSQLLDARVPLPDCHAVADADTAAPGHAPARAAHPLTHHCGYCVLQADLPYLPTLPAALPAPEVPPARTLPLLRLVPASIFVWLAAQPRAPPAN